MIYHKILFPKVVKKLFAVVCLVSVRNAAKTVQNIAAEHPTREKSLSRKCAATSISLWWELAVSQGLGGTLTKAESCHPIPNISLQELCSYICPGTAHKTPGLSHMAIGLELIKDIPILPSALPLFFHWNRNSNLW